MLKKESYLFTKMITLYDIVDPYELDVFCECGYEAPNSRFSSGCPRCGKSMWMCFAIHTIEDIPYHKYSGRKCLECKYRFICFTTVPEHNYTEFNREY